MGQWKRRSEAARRKRLSTGEARDADIGCDCRTTRPDFGRDRCGATQSGGFEVAVAARTGVFSIGPISALKKVRKPRNRSAATRRARRPWIREQGLLDPARSVFIDETAVSTNWHASGAGLTRGVRLIGHVALGMWKNRSASWLVRTHKRSEDGSGPTSTGIGVVGSVCEAKGMERSGSTVGKEPGILESARWIGRYLKVARRS